jgi:beta-glucanase (GH16 family)
MAKFLTPFPLLAVLALLAALVIIPAQSAHAARPTLVVGSPTSNSPVAGTYPIRARLDVGRKSRVRNARFYLQGKLIATDRRAPFSTRERTTFDTNVLPTGPNQLRFKVRYTIRRSNGKIVKSSRTKTVSVVMFRPPSTPAALAAAHWRLGLNDDFTSPAVSSSLWSTQRDDWIKNGVPYSNLEGAGYLPSNVKVADGTLQLSTSNRSASGFNQSTGSVNTHKRFAFKYGYIESRMLIPACAGCWPAFWLLPSGDYWPPEIDIIEYFDTSKQVVPYSAVHWRTNEPDKEDYFSERLRITDQDNYIGSWHTYGMLWTADSVLFYIDGVAGPQFSVKAQIPHEPMYPIIQLAIGAGHRPTVGSTMSVDYVRAWLPTS